MFLTLMNRKKIERHIQGYSAVVAQHECDHLDGVIYVDKIEQGTLCFLKEYKKHRDSILDFALDLRRNIQMIHSIKTLFGITNEKISRAKKYIERRDFNNARMEIRWY